ncbi:hypothetical protein NMG60_11028119 [Bertholletia excelsa]
MKELKKLGIWLYRKLLMADNILEEIEGAKKRFGKLNTIVRNAVLKACVHCGDVDSALRVFEEMSKPESCGVDEITYGTLLKGLGDARRIDETFQLLENMEQGTAVGSPKLSALLIYGLLNALIESGDVRRANGLLARFGFLLNEGSNPSILIYNLLMKGFVSTGFPLAALWVHDEILRHELKPDRHTYNTLIFACFKAGKFDDRAKTMGHDDILPDAVTYTTLLKFMKVQLLLSRSLQKCFGKIPDQCYTLNYSITGSRFEKRTVHRTGKVTGSRFTATKGEYLMVKDLYNRMWTDSSGTIYPAIQVEANHLLMEAALSDGQTNLAVQYLSSIIKRWKKILWTSRGGMVAVQIGAMLDVEASIFSPPLLPWLQVDDPIKCIMTPFEDALLLQANLNLEKVVMHFFKEPVVPIIDDWGSCVGLLHHEDCSELNAPLSSMMRSPPPCVPTSMSVGHVIDLMLEKRHKMVIVVNYGNLYGTSYSSSLRAIGVFTSEQLHKLTLPA